MPIGNVAPDAKLLVTEGVLQLSVGIGAVQVATAFEPDVVKLIFCGQLLKTGGIASAMQVSDKMQEPEVGFIKVKPNPPRCPLLNVNKPLPPNWSVFCPFAPKPT